VAIAIAVTSAGAAVAAWRGEDHARVAEEQDRAAFAQRIALEQEKAEIRETTLVDAMSDYVRMKTVAFTARALDAAAKQPGVDSGDAQRLRVEAVAERHLQYDILDGIPKDALTAQGRMSAVTLNTGTGGIPDCPRTKKGSIESAKTGKFGKFGLDLSFEATRADLCPTEEIAASRHSFGRANDQIGLTAFFILAAFLFTIGQVSSRPRAVVGAITGGSAVFLASFALLVFFEVS
jgi:hypothetical protein